MICVKNFNFLNIQIYNFDDMRHFYENIYTIWDGMQQIQHWYDIIYYVNLLNQIIMYKKVDC